MRHGARPVPLVLWNMCERNSQRLGNWLKQAPCLDPDGPLGPYSRAGDRAEGDKVVQKRKEPMVFVTLTSLSKCLLELSRADTLKRDTDFISCQQTWGPPQSHEDRHFGMCHLGPPV